MRSAGWLGSAAVAVSLLLPAPTIGTYQPLSAAVSRVEITRREQFAGGVAFGATGAYEKLVGTAFLEVDPADPRNALIQDIDKVPRNARGMVEYSTEVYILKPVDLKKGNAKIFFQVNNRGNKSVLQQFDDAPASNDPATAGDAGNGFLLREGYTLAWSGWESDVLPGLDRMTIRLPTASEGGAEVTGPLTVRFDVARQIPLDGAVSLPLSGRADSDSYQTASLDPASATLSVQDDVATPERTISPDQWAFATCRRNMVSGAIEDVTPSRKDICLFDGFDPNQLYTLRYTARNPKPLALGFAVTRDVLSWLRYEPSSPLGDAISRVYCWGNSQTGRYLRSFLYLGFNEDTQGRRACDGVIAHLAGAQGLDLNTRFSNLDAASQWGAVGLYPRDLFPFSYGVTTDPVTGRTDGILKRPSTDPLVMHIDTENEFFQAYASLVTHDGLGNPLQLPDSMRYYFLSNAQHTSGSPSTRGICAQPTNPLNYNAFMRAALVALDEWASQGVPPPPSQYPRADDGTAVAEAEARAAYPAIPGVQFGTPNQLTVRNYGPGVTAAGGVTTLSPGVEVPSLAYTVLVPRTDADGLDLAGLRKPDDVSTPIATVNGWGVRGTGFRAGALCGLNGQYVPFPSTQAERVSSGDPRLSIEERYPSHAAYVRRVAVAATDLADARYLLPEDVDRIIEQAEARQVP
jgi:Alpha/beta hydrolase domain